MLKPFTITAAAALTALLLFSGCSDSKKTAGNDKAEALIAKTVYTLEGIDGSKFEITKAGPDFAITGTPEPIVVYDIFATWCPPCRAEAPHLSSLQKKLAGKIKFIGISIEEGKDNAYYQRFADDIGITYTLVNSPDNQRFSRALAGVAGVGQDFPIPLMIVYKNGRFVKFYSGLVPEEMLESDLTQLAEAK
jgi:thiol-disulfide isomerase/thioredoxin